jgi:hypothetical protein
MAEQDAAAKAVEKLTVSSQPVRVAAAVLQRHSRPSQEGKLTPVPPYCATQAADDADDETDPVKKAKKEEKVRRRR